MTYMLMRRAGFRPLACSSNKTRPDVSPTKLFPEFSMKWAASLTVILIAGEFLLASCSADPNTRKLKFMKSGDRYFQAGKYREAVIEFRNAVEIDPQFADAHYQLGRSYLALKSADAAFREFSQAVALEPSNSQAQLELAALLLDRQKWDQAQTTAEKSSEAEPENPRPHAILGQKYTLTHDLPNAIQEFQKLVKLEPQRVENYGAL